jgi:hypothetical protein
LTVATGQNVLADFQGDILLQKHVACVFLMSSMTKICRLFSSKMIFFDATGKTLPITGSGISSMKVTGRFLV